MPDLALGHLIVLVAISLLAGIGITAVGPGGVLVTIVLFSLTGLSPSVIAGTAVVTHVGTGVVGTFTFWKAGEFSSGRAMRLTRILCVVTLFGIPLGIGANRLVDRGDFGVLLGGLSGALGLAVWNRQRLQSRDPHRGDSAESGPVPMWRPVVVGTSTAGVSAFFGLGGPMICVPGLVAIGVPILPALAAAQIQSILIAGLAAVGYATHGAINWPLAILTAVPQMLGVVLGVKIARSVSRRGLALVLGAVLIVLAPYLVFFGE